MILLSQYMLNGERKLIPLRCDEKAPSGAFFFCEDVKLTKYIYNFGLVLIC